MKRLFFIPLIGALTLALGAYLLEGGNILLLFQITAALGTYGLTFVMLLTQYSPSEMGKAFSAAVKGGTAKELKISLTYFGTMQRLAIVSGLFMPALGCIHIGMNTSEISKITGFLIALLMVSILYSLSIMLFITIPFSGAIKKRMVE
ncbi:MAG: hypothetical protein AABZ39_20055 [Spirochaetota bacterium]